MLFRSLGDALQGLGRLPQAIRAYEKLIEFAPQDFVGHAKLGWCYSQAGRNRDALEAFLRAAKINSQDADLHYCLGETYLKLGNREGAEQEYKVLRDISAPLAQELQRLLKSKNPDDRESPTNS